MLCFSTEFDSTLSESVRFSAIFLQSGSTYFANISAKLKLFANNFSLLIRGLDGFFSWKKCTSFYIKIDKFTVHFKSFDTHNGYAWNVQISLFSSVRIGKKTGSKKKNPKNKKYKIFLNIIFITFNTILFVRFLHNMIKEHNLDPISLLKNFNWRKNRTDQDPGF